MVCFNGSCIDKEESECVSKTVLEEKEEFDSPTAFDTFSLDILRIYLLGPWICHCAGRMGLSGPSTLCHLNSICNTQNHTFEQQRNKKLYDMEVPASFPLALSARQSSTHKRKVFSKVILGNDWPALFSDSQFFLRWETGECDLTPFSVGLDISNLGNFFTVHYFWGLRMGHYA